MPHIVAYRKDILAAQKAYEYKGNTTVKDPRKPYRARMSYAWVELVIEVKYSHLDGGFSFDKDLLRDSIKGKKARAQLIRYATQIMHHQHRMHLYMVCMTRSHARLLRWDRAGVLVSESIDLAAHPEQLLDFIHRFAQMTPEQRGRDPTAILVEEDSGEFRRFKKFKAATDWARKCHKEIFADTTDFPIYKVSLSVASCEHNVLIACRIDPLPADRILWCTEQIFHRASVVLRREGDDTCSIADR